MYWAKQKCENYIKFIETCSEMEIKAESIEMKFLVNKNSYLLNGSVFSITERHGKKIQNIFSADDWYNIIKICKKKASLNLI